MCARVQGRHTCANVGESQMCSKGERKRKERGRKRDRPKMKKREGKKQGFGEAAEREGKAKRT